MSTSTPTNPHLSAAGRVSILSRHRGPNHPDVVAARAELREVRLAEAIAREAEADPPLTSEQRARLAVLLLHSGGGSDAAA